jgi:NADPH:quinone reductase-like Zn-dependent oxidoreductase
MMSSEFAFAGETREDLLALKEMIERGSIRSIVDTVYPLADASIAHARVESEQRLGAIVLSLDEAAKHADTR